MSNRAETESDLIRRLLDEIDRENAARLEYEPVMPREQAERAMRALLWLYGTRNGSAASVYGSVALSEALEGMLVGRT